jgi:hypothetical protein
MSSFLISVPTDGPFLRRECPSCVRQFKWHHGPTDDRPDDDVDPPVYFCPYCGESAPGDHWWTQEQLEYARQASAGPIMRVLTDGLRKGLRTSRNSMVKFSVDHDDPETSAPLIEPADMVIVLSPCHPWEPIKITEGWNGPIHCLVCGDPFSV